MQILFMFFVSRLCPISVLSVSCLRPVGLALPFHPIEPKSQGSRLHQKQLGQASATLSSAANAPGGGVGMKTHAVAAFQMMMAGRGGGGTGSLEEITNQIFDDLMRGKSQVAHGNFDELGIVELKEPGPEHHHHQHHRGSSKTKATDSHNNKVGGDGGGGSVDDQE